MMKQNTPFLSVIVPVHNAEMYIKRCVESIVFQDYPNYEVILIENNSSDASFEKCDELAMKYAKVRVVQSKEKGVSAARNKGLELAKGDIITFCDADDYYEPDVFQKLIDEMLRVNSDILVFGMNVADADEKIIAKKLLSDSGIWEKKEYLERTLLDNNIMGSCCNRFYRRDIIGMVRFSSELSFMEDTCFNFMITKNKPDAAFYYMNLVGYNYQQNPHSATNCFENLFSGVKLGYIEALEKIERNIKLSGRLKRSIAVKKICLVLETAEQFPLKQEFELRKERIGYFKKIVVKYAIYYIFFSKGRITDKTKNIIRILLL